MKKETLSTVPGFEPGSFDCLPVEKGTSEAFVAQLVRAVDQQSEDSGSNPGTAESVFFPPKDF